MDTTQWVRANYKAWLTTFGISLSLTLGVVPAQAAYRVHLDQPTVQRGYTASLLNGKFSLGIPAGAFSDPLLVTLKQPQLAEQAAQLEVVDTSWTLVGKIRTYNLALSQPQTSAQPVWVSLYIPSDEHQDYFLAFFDRETSQWKVIPSTIDLPNHRLTGALPFTYATLAVFSTPQIGPQPVDDFQSADSVLGSLQAASAVVLDVETGELLYSKNPDEVRSIASMTKVVTTYLALGYADDWSKTVSYSDAWTQEGAALNIVNGETISIQDLLYTTLVGSANNTAVGLANVFTDQTTFVTGMNAWVTSLGLTATHFVEPSGLDAGNVSTANEYALLAQAAFKSFTMLQLSTTKIYTLHLPVTGEHTIHTTNNLLLSDLYLTGGKTGYTEEAGYCLMIQTKNADGHQIIVVVMGEPTSADRFTETYALAKWAFANYQWN